MQDRERQYMPRSIDYTPGFSGALLIPAKDDHYYWEDHDYDTNVSYLSLLQFGPFLRLSNARWIGPRPVRAAIRSPSWLASCRSVAKSNFLDQRTEGGAKHDVHNAKVS